MLFVVELGLQWIEVESFFVHREAEGTREFLATKVCLEPMVQMVSKGLMVHLVKREARLV